MTILFIAAGGIEFGSSRMRVHWPAKHMDASVIVAGKDLDGLAQGAPVNGPLIFQKVAPLPIMRDYHESGHTVWWDVCDPSWWFEPKECQAIVQNIDGVVASSEPLLKDFMTWMSEVPISHEIQAHVIPDRLDFGHFPKVRRHREARPVRLIWYGVYANRVSLHAAIPTLERLACNGYDFTLTIYDNYPDRPWQMSKRFDTYHTQWDVERENEVLTSHDIALLPPYPGKWGQVKSNNKTITAYANGLPVTQGVEYCELESLMRWQTRREAGANGRAMAEKHYDVSQSARDWEAILCAS